MNGKYPEIIEKPIKSVNLGIDSKYREIEKRLTTLEFKEAKGDEEINDQNVLKFETELKYFFWDQSIMNFYLHGITCCSNKCRGEINSKVDYSFLGGDGRLKLRCGHFSMHVGCIAWRIA